MLVNFKNMLIVRISSVIPFDIDCLGEYATREKLRELRLIIVLCPTNKRNPKNVFRLKLLAEFLRICAISLNFH